jgi:hypothetical protein
MTHYCRNSRGSRAAGRLHAPWTLSAAQGSVLLLPGLSAVVAAKAGTPQSIPSRGKCSGTGSRWTVQPSQEKRRRIMKVGVRNRTGFTLVDETSIIAQP